MRSSLRLKKYGSSAATNMFLTKAFVHPVRRQHQNVTDIGDCARTQKHFPAAAGHAALLFASDRNLFDALIALCGTKTLPAARLDDIIEHYSHSGY